MKIKPGFCFYKDMDRRKYHVVTVLTEEENTQVVLKYYGIRKQWWHYEIKSLYSVEQSFRIGLYILKKPTEFFPTEFFQ